MESTRAKRKRPANVEFRVVQPTQVGFSGAIQRSGTTGQFHSIPRNGQGLSPNSTLDQIKSPRIRQITTKSHSLANSDSMPTEKAPSKKLLSFATRIWGDRQSALVWFRSPHPELQGQTPSSLLKIKGGAQKVEDLLGALEYGFPV